MASGKLLQKSRTESIEVVIFLLSET